MIHITICGLRADTDPALLVAEVARRFGTECAVYIDIRSVFDTRSDDWSIFMDAGWHIGLIQSPNMLALEHRNRLEGMASGDSAILLTIGQNTGTGWNYVDQARRNFATRGRIWLDRFAIARR